MTSGDLESITQELVAEGKGILAADETVITLTRRSDTLGVRSTGQGRRTHVPGNSSSVVSPCMTKRSVRRLTADRTLRGRHPDWFSTRYSTHSSSRVSSLVMIHRIAATGPTTDGTTVSTRRREAQFNDTTGGNNGTRAIPERAIID